ncbi:MAG: tRNA lysidine(34) synthetase TilS [Candidatus Kapaibacterium sp.]
MASSHSHPLTEKTRAALASLGASSDSKLLVAVSGGPDSLAMAHVLQSLRGRGAFQDVAVAHVNHGIRKDAAEREENAVRRYCEEWKVAFEVKRVHTMRIAQKEKIGIEETARKQRYDFFEELSKLHGFDFILTAHTANDQAETVLMHLVRGAGVRGLAGILPKRKLGSAYLLRPWLDVTRNEILDYLEEFHLFGMHDTSNDELSYQRNRVRHKVMPVIAEVWPDRSPVRAIAGLAERMRELSIFLDTLTEETLDELREGGGLSLTGLKHLRGFPLHAVIETWIARTIGLYSLSAQETYRIEQWLDSKSKTTELHGGVRLKKASTILCIEKNKESLAFKPTLLIAGTPLQTPYGEFLLHYNNSRAISRDPFVVTFDEKGMGKEPAIRIRPWRKGDRMAPFGMDGKRKLVSDLLTEAGITGERRKNYPVVELDEEILWLPGIRRCDHARVNSSTRSVLEFSFKPL